MPELNDTGQREHHRLDGTVSVSRYTFHLLWDSDLTRGEIRQVINDLHLDLHTALDNAPDDQFRKATP